MTGPDVRRICTLVRGSATRDGAGVRLTRVIGGPELEMLDPFLLLDVFRSDRPDDYVAGFPPHPHRGFETVTLLIHGRMRHRDSAGHEGVIEAGGVQWMTAGRGIVHSEMPEQEHGLLEGFQLWINLPADHKMLPPAYQEHPAGAIPEESRPGTRVRVVAGETTGGTRGPIRQPLTAPLLLDVELRPGAAFGEDIPAGHNAFVFVFRGQASVPARDGGTATIPADHLAILGPGRGVRLEAGEQGARLLLVAGRPLGEPVVRGGPFVMNTEAELRQAFDDYRRGRLAQP